MPRGILSEEFTSGTQEQTNRFIFIKQQHIEKSSHNCSNGSQKVLVNPHFKQKKVFINPKFSGVKPIQPNNIYINPHLKNLNNTILGEKQYLKIQPFPQDVPSQSTKIHINPHAKSVQISLNKKLLISQPISQVVHINPNFKNISVLNNVLLNNTLNMPHIKKKENFPCVSTNRTIVLTRTKLIRTSATNNKNESIKRRNLIKSKYKIVKSSFHSSPKRTVKTSAIEENKFKNRYKIDHRRRKSLSIIGKSHRKYVYTNRFIGISDLAKTCLIKGSPVNPVKSMVSIHGEVYRKSRTSLRKTSVTSYASIKKSPSRTPQVSKYKLVLKNVTASKPGLENKMRVTENSVRLKKFKINRKSSPKKNKAAKVSPRKLRKCNVPCPYYKKYGLCRGKENGKCFRKHDPDQIALCTRFLQGACIEEKCLLSHNVSPEKMPTCKYYLEGSCSKENCPYLHIRINPKAEVCRDFLEGFCKKAAECDKRHQYLCPDYEKYGNCLKQRCPYPHGKLVRNYFSDKAKFAKKSSDPNNKFLKQDQSGVLTSKSVSKSVDLNICKNKKEQVLIDKQRYYEEKKSKTEEITDKPSTSKNTLENPENNGATDQSTTKNFIGLQSRPKLGTLPAFIPFGK